MNKLFGIGFLLFALIAIGIGHLERSHFIEKVRQVDPPSTLATTGLVMILVVILVGDWSALKMAEFIVKVSRIRRRFFRPSKKNVTRSRGRKR